MFLYLRIFAFVVFLVISRHVVADGLDTYLATLGPATDIRVQESAPLRPSRIAFQSQVWRDIPWRHEILVKNPPAMSRTDTVVVMLTGGQGGGAYQKSAQDLADALGIRVAILTRVPNQPLYGGKTEDVLLSFTLNQYRHSGDSSWPLLFPMVSSVVKGIDVLQEVLGEPKLRIILIGASKRGWTTYLAAGVDKRIIGMIPAVFEMVSMERQIALARSRYGQDSEKIRPYTALGLTDALLEPRVAQLVQWLDPISYVGRYTVPKLVLLGANDPYWVVDSVRRYWDLFPEPKMLRMLPNEGHGVLSTTQAQQTIVTFIRDLVESKRMPRVSWIFSDSANGRAIISGDSEQRLELCRLWRATSDSADFRKAVFEQRPCNILGDGKSFMAYVTTCNHQNTAAFVEVVVAASNHRTTVERSTESHVWLGSGPIGEGRGSSQHPECR